MELLERDGLLQDLLRHVEDASRGRGRMVFLHGEAGVGKTTVVQRLFDLVRPGARVLIGSCDPLTTPRPLGPLLDITPHLGPAVERALTETVSGDGSAFEVFRYLLDDLSPHRRHDGRSGPPQPTVLVFEDLHWADDATLDLLRYLGRHIEETSTLLVATYRDDELGRKHPLTVLLGDLADSTAVRLQRIEPLSRQAVARLAAGRRIDVERLYQVTGGNPFYVTEILDAQDDEIPPTVRQTILGRLARLSEQAYAVVETTAVIGNSAALKLIAAVAPDSDSAVAEALACGVLCASDETIGFSNELARMTVLEAIPTPRRIRLHGLVLKAMESGTSGARDVAYMAHHAEQAGNDAATLKYSLAAAIYASALGAHRQSAEHYARALRHTAALRTDEQGVLLENRAYECYMFGDIAAATADWTQAIELHRSQGNRLREGDDLRWVSLMLLLSGHNSEAALTGERALSVLGALEPSPALGWAYVNQCRLASYARDADKTAAYARQAVALGERFGEPGMILSARFHVALVQPTQTSRGWDELDEMVDRAIAENMEEQAVLFALTLSWVATVCRDFERAVSVNERALAYCVEHDLTAFALLVRGLDAMGLLHRGLWTEAADAAVAVLTHPSPPPLCRVMPLTALALIRARRGDPDVWPLLDEALGLGEPGDLGRLGPVWEARAEAAWLAGDDARAVEEAMSGLATATSHSGAWLVGPLIKWIRRAGGTPPAMPLPKVLTCEVDGDWQQAAERWERTGCPYDAALARLDGDAEAVRTALAAFEALEARPCVEYARARLKELGVRPANGGPRSATRSNPYQLTSRELQILHLLHDGLSDAGIADRLHITRKTASHHVSAILTKLGVRSRHEAARKLGSLPHSSAE